MPATAALRQKIKDLDSIDQDLNSLFRANTALIKYGMNINRVPKIRWRVYCTLHWLGSAPGPTYLTNHIGLGVLNDWIESPDKMARELLAVANIPLPPGL